jgi:hypothetical protein
LYWSRGGQVAFEAAVADVEVPRERRAPALVEDRRVSGTKAFLAKKLDLAGYNSYFFSVSDDNKGA